MKRWMLILILVNIFTLSSCFINNKEPRVNLPTGIYESDTFIPNEKNYLYGRIEIKEITKEEYEEASGLNVGVEDVTNKYVHFDLGLYNDQTNEFEYYDIKEFEIDHLNNRFFWYTAKILSKSNPELSTESLKLTQVLEKSFLLNLYIDHEEYSAYYVSEDTIEYNDPIPLGTFRSNDFLDNSRYSYCIVEIKEITEEEYKNANGKNVIVDLFDRKGVRKYCSIVFYFYDFKQEEWIECETKYGYYYISNGTYFGILYRKGTNTFINSFELKINSNPEHAFSMKLWSTEVYFANVE